MRRAAVALVVTVACVISGCGSDDDADDSTPTTTVAAATTTTDAPTTTVAEDAPPASDVPTSDAPATTTAAPADTAGDPVPDGTSFGYLTAVSVADSTITIDIAELLTGDAAVKAAIADGALEPGETSIDNDYYISNKNPKLRTAPVSASTTVNVLAREGAPELTSGSLAGLADHLAGAVSYEPGEPPKLPVQVVASGGTVTRIDEVFFP